MQSFPGTGRVDFTIWMHYMDDHKAFREKATLELYKSWKQHPTKKQLYGHLPSIF